MKSLSQLNAYSTSTVLYTDESLGAGQVLANRYQINGLLDTGRPVLENIELMTNAAGSWLSYDIHEGKWGVVINSSATSVASFDDSNIIGSISLSGTGLQDLYNSVKVEFPHRELKDSADFIQDEIPDVDRNANEVDNVLNITYDIINDPVQAELLGLLELKQSRVDLVIGFRTDFSYINLKAGDVVSVTNARYGFVNKPFRIITITEVQDDDGSLQMEISALEYDDNVYVADLYKYTRTDANGIITIGSIGKPGTPQVTKFEQASRPRVLIESTTPTGIVEGLEFWLSTDVSQADDDLRSYRLIATRRPVGGGTFTSGTEVELDYDSLGATNFVIKTRGINSTTVGPYSDPSGFVYFAPVQTTDAIGPDTAAIDATGGLLTALAVIDLLKGVDGLFGGSTTSTSMWKKIFDIFKDETGVDIVEQAETGGLAPQTLPYVTVRDENNLLTNQVSSINFVGNGVVATKSGNDVTVTIGTQVNPGAGSSVEIDNPCGLKVGDVPVWNGSKWTSSSDPGTAPAVCGIEYIDVLTKWPPDRATYQDPITQLTSDTAPITGSYFLKYTGRPFYGPLIKGTGNAYLYTSDGTLKQTLAASAVTIDKNVVELPFADRELGTDYYILIDEGFVMYCSAKSRAITPATIWNFNTPLYETTPYSVTGDPSEVPTPPISVGDIAFLQYANVAGTYVIPNPDPCETGYVTGSGRSTATFDVIKPLSGESYFVKSPGQINTGYKDGDIIRIPARNVGGNSGFLYLTVGDACGGNINSFSGDLPPNLKVGPCSQLLLATSSSPVAGTGNVTIDDGAGGTYTIAVAGKSAYGDNYLNLGVLTGKVSLGRTHTVTIPAGAVQINPAEQIDCYQTFVPGSGATIGGVEVINTLTLTSFVVSSSPITNDTGKTKVNPQTNIELVFNEQIALGDSGTITLYNSSGSVHQTFNVATSFEANKTNEIIWASGNSVYLNPTKDLSIKNTYYVQASSGSVKSHCQSWTGIANSSTVRFTIDAGPVLLSNPPTVTTTSTGVINLSYDRPIEASTGSIRILQSGIEVYAIPSTWTGIIYN